MCGALNNWAAGERRVRADKGPAKQSAPSKFEGACGDLVFGRPEDAALGVLHFMCVGRDALPLAQGVEAIAREVATHGSASDRECLRYVLHERAGSSPLLFSNSAFPRDCDAHGLRNDRRAADGLGMRLADFVAHPKSRAACLEEAHVVALRLYSTSA